LVVFGIVGLLIERQLAAAEAGIIVHACRFLDLLRTWCPAPNG
jgi:hypothetical protein